MLSLKFVSKGKITVTRLIIGQPKSARLTSWYRLFLDWDDDELDQYTLYRGNIQVVLRNNNSLLTTLEPWLEWKKQKGWQIELLTDQDANFNSPSSIRSELIDRWDASETKFDYVVIVGDNRGSYPVPPASGEGDHDYGLMEGADDLMDVAVGRISIENNSDLRTYINKVLHYERDPYMDETTWYKRGQVAYSSTNSGSSPVYVGRYQRQAMLDAGYTHVDTAWASPYGDGNVNNRSISRINNGVSFYGARGYISSGLSTNQIYNLNNDYMIPVVIDITCGTGNWAQNWGDGINEAYMRAGSQTVPRGGIGGMGTATSSTHTRFNNALSGVPRLP